MQANVDSPADKAIHFSYMQVPAYSVYSAQRKPVSRCNKVRIWLSTADQKYLLSELESINSEESGKKSQYNIKIREDIKYQKMEGFGASLTDSSSFLLQKRIKPEVRAEIMEKLFGKTGISLNLIRQPMGSCDYNINLYTYDNEPGDTELKKFSIDPDRKYIIPSIKDALSINREIRIIASPWSAPGWMKTSGSIIGGELKPGFYNTYAMYFVKFIKSYQNEGIHVYAITPQNEPLFLPAHYPGMSFSADSEADFIKMALGPLFKKNGIDTKILIYDHNWDKPEYPLEILKDKEANMFIAGVAWHYYGGSHEAMSKVHEAYPDKEVWFTEGSGGEWVPEFHDAFMDQMMHIIRIPRNWSKSVIWWNLALDEEHGPSILGDWSTCRGLVRVDTKTCTVSYNVDYYTIAHISKFVNRGAYRIDSNTYKNDLENVAFLNPDSSKVLIVSNRSKESKTFTASDGKRHFVFSIPGEGAATFKW